MLLEEDEEVRIDRLDDRAYCKLAERFGIVDAGGRVELARGKTELIEFEMQDLFESACGVRLPKGTAVYREAAYAFLKASVKAKASYNAEKWFRHLLCDTGLRDKTLGKALTGMHVFRSMFLNRALNLRIRDAELITGHAGGRSTVVRGYEGELELQHKREIIEKITFDVDVPKPVKPILHTERRRAA